MNILKIFIDCRTSFYFQARVQQSFLIKVEISRKSFLLAGVIKSTNKYKLVT